MKLLFTFLFLGASQILFANNINIVSDSDTTSSLNLVWKFKASGKINSSPCSDKDFIYFGSEDNNMYALNRHTGVLAWQFQTNGKINSSPIVSGSKLFFLSMDGFFYSLNTRTGKLLWKFKTGGEKKIDIWDYYLSDPVADENTVYFGSSDSSVYALQLETGKLKWSYKTEGCIHAKPVLHNDSLFVGNFDGYFYALDAHNGNMIWKFRSIGDLYFPKGELQKGALYYHDNLWFGSRDYNIYALNPKTGRGVWNMKENGSWIIATPVANGKYLYFGTSDSHAFYCIDITTGETKWKLKMNMRAYGSAAISDGIVFFGCFNGKLYGADELTGKMKYEFKTEGCKENYYTVYDSTDHFKKGFSIYGNTVQEFEAAEAKIMALGSITSTPLIIDSIIYFGSTDGYFYAVKK